MASGICVYAETCNGKLDPVVAELITAAKLIKKETKETISAIVADNDCQNIINELSGLGAEKIYAVNTGRDMLLQDESAAYVIAEMLKKIEPSSVLVPATPNGRSIFSRVAMKLNCGMTADCTELLVGKREDGSCFIKQNKPSFGENVFVTIVTADNVYPQMMTIRPGVYQMAEKTTESAEVVYFDDIKAPESKVRVLESIPSEAETDSILSADILVVGGRGALEDGNFELLKKFADKIGAAIGGTRPMVDSGLIPFDHQIGQTGFTVRPKIAVSLGVSGAIQHTEGIKDTKLYIAINSDENAAIFNVADYGAAANMCDILSEYLLL